MSKEIGLLSRRLLIRVRRVMRKGGMELSAKWFNHPDKNRASVALCSVKLRVRSNHRPARLPGSERHKCSENWCCLRSTAAVRFIARQIRCAHCICSQSRSVCGPNETELGRPLGGKKARRALGMCVQRERPLLARNGIHSRKPGSSGKHSPAQI